MIVKYLLILSVLFLASCDKQLEENAKVENSQISLNSISENSKIPYADSSSLAEFKNDKSIINYNFARKLALIELDGSGFQSDLKWTGYALSKQPVIIYGFDSKPKFYEFIVKDAENNAIGTVTVHARRQSSTMLNEVIPSVKNYSTLFLKSKNSGSKIISGIAGQRYVGLVGKSGDTPTEVVDPISGDLITGQQELTDEQILKAISDTLKIIDKYTKISINSLPNSTYKDSLIIADSIPIESKIETLKQRLIEEKNYRKEYWNLVDTYSDSIQALSDEEIISKSKGLGSLIRIFDFKNDAAKKIDKFRNNISFAKGGWCGPWAMNYIYNSVKGGNDYSHFEKFAGTIGLVGSNFVFSAISGTKPMFPSEMNLSMVSRGIWIDPTFYFNQWDGYYYVRIIQRPLCIAIVTSGQGHWIVAYGTKTTGTYAWRNYWYAINDNGTMTSNSEYWWQAPWFMAYVRVLYV